MRRLDGTARTALFTARCRHLRREHLEHARRPFKVIRREEIKAPPQLVPQWDTIHNHPAQYLCALSHLGLFRPWLRIIRIRNDPESVISLSIVDLIDHFNDSSTSTGHQPG